MEEFLTQWVKLTSRETWQQGGIKVSGFSLTSLFLKAISDIFILTFCLFLCVSKTGNKMLPSILVGLVIASITLLELYLSTAASC